jgi:hypothetical protein
MKKRALSAEFVTGFGAGWSEDRPDLMVLTLTTSKGIQDFAVNKEQALQIAKIINETAERLAKPRVS